MKRLLTLALALGLVLVPTPAYAGDGAPGRVPLFNAGYSPFRKVVTGWPKHTQSAAILAQLVATNSTNYLTTTPTSTNGFAMPYYTGTASDPVRRPLTSGPPELRAGGIGVHIPADAAPMGGSDGEMTIFDLVNNIVVELGSANVGGVSASTGSVAYFNTDGLVNKVGLPESANGGSPLFVESDDRNSGQFRGYNAAITGVTYQEAVTEGVIRHPFKIAVNDTCEFVWPAVGGEQTGCAGKPYGMLKEGLRLRLDPGLTLTGRGLTPTELIIATALQQHGILIWDQSGGAPVLKMENTVAEGRGDLWAGKVRPGAFNVFPFTEAYWDVLPGGYNV